MVSTRSKRALTRAVPVAAAAVLAACGGDGDDAPAGYTGPLSVAEFQQRCAQLAGAAVPGGRVTTAAFTAAGTENNQPVPDHCVVQGKINERTGVDGKPYAIGFELRLPRDWNTRFFFQGAGGTVGTLGAARGSLPGAGPAPASGLPVNALSRGFAVASSDAGHLNEPGVNGPYLFGADPQARIDYGELHLPTVTAAARALMSTAYGAEPQRSYFAGCSNGGRQAMKATQLYPQLFDGVLVGAPAYRVTRSGVDTAAETQLFASISPPGAADNRPALWNAFSNAELALVSSAITQACDARDGVADGMVNLTGRSRCDFDPTVLQCTGGTTTNCLAPAKASVLRSIFAGLRNSRGELIYSDWPWDPGISDPGWRSWKIGTAPAAGAPQVPNAANTTLLAGALTHVFMSPPVITQDLYGFVLGLDVNEAGQRIAQPSGIYTRPGTDVVDATSSDVSAYRSRGGKMIFYHGMADAIFSATDTARYVQQLQTRFGEPQTAEFVRLYQVPGMVHCSGGPATDQFELLQPLMDWVERGAAPQAVVATARSTTPWPGRTRPLCPWPAEAVYTGGSVESVASFSCR